MQDVRYVIEGRRTGRHPEQLFYSNDTVKANERGMIILDDILSHREAKLVVGEAFDMELDEYGDVYIEGVDMTFKQSEVLKAVDESAYYEHQFSWLSYITKDTILPELDTYNDYRMVGHRSTLQITCHKVSEGDE